MAWDPDRKLDVAGVALGVIVLLSLGLLAFGAAQIEPGPSENRPDVEWSVERVNATHVQIAHGGGDTMYADELSITIDGRDRPTPFDGAIRPNDTATVVASTGAEVRLHWLGGDGERELMYGERV